MTRRKGKDPDESDDPDEPDEPKPGKKKGPDLRFPFGETSSDAGGIGSDSDADELNRLLESDDPHLRPDASDSGGQMVMADTGEIPPERPRPHKKSTGMREKLPADPPGSRPEDDASLDGLEDEDDSPSASGSSEEIIALAGGASDLGPLENVSVTERIGQVGPSGPIVVIPDDDENPDASMRYQASVVDDSARVAGSVDPGRKKPKKTKERPAEWSSEDEPDHDAAVQTLSARRSARQSGVRTAPPPPPARGKAVLLALLALLLGGAAVGIVQELRWRNIAQRRAAEAEAVLLAARGESERALAAERGEAKKAAEEAAQRIQEAEAARASAASEAEAEAGRRDARARAEEQQKVAEAQAGRVRAEEALEVEVATARRVAEEAAQAAVTRAVEEEKARGQTALAELQKTEEQKRREELEALRVQLQGELQGAVTRAEEEALARQLAESRKADLDQVAPPGGGGSGGGSDIDDLFADAPSSGDGGGGGDDDLFADGGGEEEKVGLIEQAWRWARKNVHGFLAYKNLSHFSRGMNHDLRKTRHELRARLSYADWLAKTEDSLTGLRLVATLDFRVDDDDFANDWPDGVDDEQDTRPHVWPDELYLGLVHDWLEVRAGWQRFAWGTGDLFNPTDNLNPIDYSDLFDARRIAVFAASARIQLDPFALEVVSIPTFTRSRLPLPGKRFDLLRNAPITVTRPDDPDASLENVQWGARAVVRKFGWDVSVSAFTGYEDIPSADLTIISVLPPIAQATTRFDRLHVLGADFATTLGFLGLEGKLGEVLSGIQLHGEAAYFIHEGPRLDDYLQYVIGFNYQFVDLILEHDLTVIVEYAGDYQLEAADQPFPGVDLGRIFRGGVLARLQYDVSEELSFELTGGIITHGREGGLLHPAVVWDPTDWLTLELAGDVFFGARDTFFGQFKRDGRVISTIKLNF